VYQNYEIRCPLDKQQLNAIASAHPSGGWDGVVEITTEVRLSSDLVANRITTTADSQTALNIATRSNQGTLKHFQTTQMLQGLTRVGCCIIVSKCNT
jgi:hypothetical protein